jgi:hypothetical protein
MRLYMKTARKAAVYGSIVYLVLLYLTYVMALFFRLAST